MMSAIGKLKDKKISCIPNNMEKYISFSLDNLRIINSVQFLNESLDTLVNNLAKQGGSRFKNLSKHFPREEERDLLLRKGVYPYDHMSSWDRFSDKSLPPMSAFYNKLNESHISEADYAHAQNIWTAFQISDMGRYHNLYQLCDVLLLADVFENFRDLCLTSYHLDPAHFYTSPGLAWESMLKREKEGDLTQSYDKTPYTNRKFENQRTTRTNATKNFDYTTIADRLRTVSWSNK